MNVVILDKIHQQIENNIYPGASISLYNGSWNQYYVGTIDGDKLTKPDYIYDLASVSKVVGVGHLMIDLINLGIVDLDKPFREFYPDFLNSTVTLRGLLTHTSQLNPYIKNRNQMNAVELKQAILSLPSDLPFEVKYTDVNFLILGFFLEYYYKKDLDSLFKDKIFSKFGMSETGFGPRIGRVVPTVRGNIPGIVHDPKAKILGKHSGSAGIFSSLKDLEIFTEHYLTSNKYKELIKNESRADKPRALAWDLQEDWLIHTGYTGTFIMFNRIKQKAAIFLSNRTYDKDEREQWILDRNELIEIIKYQL